MTEQELEKLAEIWCEENASWAKLGNNDNAKFIFKAGYTAGHQDASAEKDKEIEALKKSINFHIEFGEKELLKSEKELSALKESAKGLVDFIASLEPSVLAIGHRDERRAILKAYNAKIGGNNL